MPCAKVISDLDMELDARKGRFSHKMDKRGPYNFGRGKTLVVTIDDEIEIKLEEF